MACLPGGAEDRGGEPARAVLRARQSLFQVEQGHVWGGRALSAEHGVGGAGAPFSSLPACLLLTFIGVRSGKDPME